MNSMPTNEAELDAVLALVQKHVRQKEMAEALAVCDSLIANEATRLAGYRERAEVRLAMHKPDLAAEDLRSVVDLGSDEPADFHALGIVYLKLGRPRDAANVFASAIDLGEREGFHYYTNSALFHRAEAYRRAGLMKAARADAERLPTAYECFIAPDGVQTKEQLLQRLERESPRHRS